MDFDRLWAKYEGLIISECQRLSGKLPTQFIELADIVQEARIRISERLAYIVATDNTDAFLRHIIRYDVAARIRESLPGEAEYEVLSWDEIWGDDGLTIPPEAPPPPKDPRAKRDFETVKYRGWTMTVEVYGGETAKDIEEYCQTIIDRFADRDKSPGLTMMRYMPRFADYSEQQLWRQHIANIDWGGMEVMPDGSINTHDCPL